MSNPQGNRRPHGKKPGGNGGPGPRNNHFKRKNDFDKKPNNNFAKKSERKIDSIDERCLAGHQG